MKTTYIFLGIIGILMYNMFLIQRDQKMFEGYNKMNAKEHHCSELKVWHPDCKVE
jgi:hypothetical protein